MKTVKNCKRRITEIRNVKRPHARELREIASLVAVGVWNRVVACKRAERIDSRRRYGANVAVATFDDRSKVDRLFFPLFRSVHTCDVASIDKFHSVLTSKSIEFVDLIVKP